MKPKEFLEEVLDSGSPNECPLAERIGGKFLFVSIGFVLFIACSYGLRRIGKDYDQRWVKWDVRINSFLNKE